MKKLLAVLFLTSCASAPTPDTSFVDEWYHNQVQAAEALLVPVPMSTWGYLDWDNWCAGYPPEYTPFPLNHFYCETPWDIQCVTACNANWHTCANAAAAAACDIITEALETKLNAQRAEVLEHNNYMKVQAALMRACYVQCVADYGHGTPEYQTCREACKLEYDTQAKLALDILRQSVADLEEAYAQQELVALDTFVMMLNDCYSEQEACMADCCNEN